ncbi:MAG: hypothetical protein ABS58_01840 [Mesorhizobium sp. SCN 65-20]|nr:MAG: hypothetical protein ABS58_01840 [Mesorhizobium sp. SCN 65-20]
MIIWRGQLLSVFAPIRANEVIGECRLGIHPRPIASRGIFLPRHAPMRPLRQAMIAMEFILRKKIWLEERS